MKKSKISLKIIFTIVTISLLVGLLFLAKYLKSVKDYQSEVSSMTFKDIDFSQLQDGTYIGECDVDFIYVKVEVIVQNGEIININLLEHKNEKGQDAEAIIDRIIEKQTVDVDAISSATNSSSVIKKAIENALMSGIQ